MTPDRLTPILEFALAQRQWEMPPSLPWLSSQLPAIPHAGLEFRLCGPAMDIFDLQQGIRSRADVDRLKVRVDEIIRRHDEAVDTGWGLLRDAIHRGAFEQPFEECWLELDDVADGKLPALSLFVKFAAGRDSADLVMHVERWLGYFGRRLGDGLRPLLRRCQAACRSGQKISYLGFMLGRPGSPLRLIVDGLAWNEFSPFLIEVGWPGDTSVLQDRLNLLFGHFDRIRLALTLGEVVEPALGLECFLGSSEEMDMRWSAALDELVDHRLCTEEWRSRILSWPDTITPATANAPWPDTMLLEAIARGPLFLSRLDFRISHVKLMFDGGELTSAKGYLGFVEVWQDLAAPTAAPVKADRASRRSPQAGCDAALAFLLKSRTPGGWWQDYPGLQNASDEWVSAYVANAVLDADDATALAAASRIWFLLSQRARAGWGWNYVKPADADSTLWALRLAARLGALGTERAQSGMDFLRTHIGPSGGLSTYDRRHVAEWSDGPPPVPGWFEVHDCVTAAGAGLESIAEGVLRHLRHSQCPDGSWWSYWWKDPAYPTAMAVEALAASPLTGDQACVARAIEWASQRLEDTICGNGPVWERGPFSLALLARILLHAPNPDTALLARMMDALLQAQLPDGSWEASAWFLLPKEEVTLDLVDHRRLITSSTILVALAELQRRLARP